MLHYGSQMANGFGDDVDVTTIVDQDADTSLFESSVSVSTFDFPASREELGVSVFRLLARLYAACNDGDFDVIHATTLNPLLIPLFAALRNTTTAVTCHDVNPHPGAGGLRTTLSLEGLVRLADNVVVHGDYNTKEFVDRFGSRKKVITVNHGHYEFFTDQCDVPLTYDRELLFFGRIRPYKGIQTLLSAAERLSEDLEDFRIVIAGNGPLDADIDHLGDHVTVRNRFIPMGEVCRLFSRCRGVILPYREASQSGIIPIAYSFQKPVIATDVGGLPEVVDHGQTGILAPPEDPETLAMAAKKLLKNKERAVQMGSNAVRFKDERMDWRDIAAELATSYSITEDND